MISFNLAIYLSYYGRLVLCHIKLALKIRCLDICSSEDDDDDDDDNNNNNICM